MSFIFGKVGALNFMRVNMFEAMLQRKSDMSAEFFKKMHPKEEDITYPDHKTKANKGATLYDLIEMISMLVTKSMKKDNVTFYPDEGGRPINDISVAIEHPMIYYKIISREPKDELKPRSREDIVEITDKDSGEKRMGRIWGARQKCVVQFDILACDYKQADKTMNDFEDLIFNYTGYLKENGVAEIIFKKHFTDTNYDIFRQSISVRSLQYYVEIEKHIVEFFSTINGVLIEQVDNNSINSKN